MTEVIIKSKPWASSSQPKKILAMRFQAFGDTVISLPYLQSLKDQLPHTKIDFLTRKEVCDIPVALQMFHRVFVIGGGRNSKLQFVLCLLLLPYLWLQRYDVVIDLQNHKISRIIRKLLFAKSWSEFDKASPVLAGERTRSAIDSLGIVRVALGVPFQFKYVISVGEKMKLSGWNGKSSIIILNPAGAFETRNWPLDNYIAFANLCLQEDENTQFMVLGIFKISEKANYFKSILKDKLIEMTSHTNPLEAFHIVKKAKLVISEDSGLMHMAWVQNVPVVAIFGSSKSFWSSPMGERSFCFSSADLPCGNCFLEKCKFADNHCLTRVTPEMVFEKAVGLLSIAI
jgi:heptosyltransferase II